MAGERAEVFIRIRADRHSGISRCSVEFRKATILYQRADEPFTFGTFIDK